MSGGQNQYQPMRADPLGLHAGSDIPLSTKGGSSDYPHFMVTEAGFGTSAKSSRLANAGTLYVANRNHNKPQQHSAAATADHKCFSMQRAIAKEIHAPSIPEAQQIPKPTSTLPLSSDSVCEVGGNTHSSWATVAARRPVPQPNDNSGLLNARHGMPPPRKSLPTKNSTTPSSTWSILRKPTSAKVASDKGDVTPLDDLRDTLAQLHCEYQRMHERTITSCTSGKGGPTILGRPKRLEPMERSVASSTTEERDCSGDYDTSVATPLAVRSAYPPPEWAASLPFNLVNSIELTITGPRALPTDSRRQRYGMPLRLRPVPSSPPQGPEPSALPPPSPPPSPTGEIVTSVWPDGRELWSEGRSLPHVVTGDSEVITYQEERHEDRVVAQADVTEPPDVTQVVLGASAFHVDHTTAAVARMYVVTELPSKQVS
jgi:hypothetical protein